jgi:prepilin-type N-terminal cleavage/methylation domain-containing protein
MRKAFTLIELMIIIAIVAIIAAIAIPNIIDARNKKVAQDRSRTEYIASQTKIQPAASFTIIMGVPAVMVGPNITVVPIQFRNEKILVRIDNGVGAAPRFSEILVFPEELQQTVVEK